MSDIAAWVSERWSLLAIPGAVFVAVMVIGLWLRRMGYRAFDAWAKDRKWSWHETAVQATAKASALWTGLVALYLSVRVSAAPPEWKRLVGLVLLSLLVVSIAVVAIRFTLRIIEAYMAKAKASPRSIATTRNIATGVITVVTALVLLDIWGIPTSPFILLLAVVIVALVLAFRNVVPNLFAGLQLTAMGQLREGDYIKLGTGEEGYLTDISLVQSRIQALDGSFILVPNDKLMHTTVTNYGRPLKKAAEPFRFYSRTHLKELTGLKAGNLWELLELLKTVPESTIYYHTHHFLEEHQYLTPEPANDFALWVSDVIGDEVLGEKLASVDTFSFSSLAALRERLVGIIEEHLATESERRNAPQGREFYFMKSVSLVTPTSYLAHDLREFVQALHKISLGSLYYHVFEARLRLGRPTNDFSVWMNEYVDEADLAEQVAHLDPYNHTLEGLRSTLVQLIEKRIK
ncbi:MAG: DUF5752 family protein [Chloroflexota bacterium]